jgi:hypothetical protein
MQLAHVATQNRVPTRQTSVRSKDAIVGTRHSSGSASVKVVRTEPVLVGLLCHAVVRVVLRVGGVDGAFGRGHECAARCESGYSVILAHACHDGVVCCSVD